MPSSRPTPFLLVASLAAALVLEAFPAEAGCPMVPRPVCRELAEARFAIDQAGNVSWRASRGAQTDLDEFGDPETSSHYFLCAWDERGLVVAADVPPGVTCPDGDCWCSVDGGLRYDDADGVNGDLRLLEMSSSEEAGTKVRTRTFVVGGINLPIVGDLLVQLSRADSEVCFENLLLASDFAQNDKGVARARTADAE